MDRSKKKPPHSFESLSFPVEPSEPAQVDQLPEVRRIWDAEEQAWYYSVVDFIKILTNAPSAVTYWTTFKKRRQDDPFLQEVFGQLKMEPMRARDGKLRETECATRPVMLRIVQSIPSKQAETVRLWLAQIGEEKLQEAEQQTQVDQLRSYYISRGRTPEWADARIRNLIGRNLLTVGFPSLPRKRMSTNPPKLPNSPSEKSSALSENVPQSIGTSKKVFDGFLDEKGLF